jgi:predicted glycoside hydrolase/deacetylase ChbG (UPF0249 family)
MRRLFFAGLLLAVGAFSQPAGKIRLLVCGDDGGAALSFNEGTILSYKNGVLRCANVLVPGPWFPDMARRLNENPGIGVGVHLTLTSEWDALKWRPLTYAPSLVDENGYLPATTKGALAKKPPLRDVERELRAQIETAKRSIHRVEWLWPHMGAVSATPELRALTLKLAREYELPLLGVDGTLRPVRARYKPADSAEAKRTAFRKMLEELQPGDWFFIDHPATDTPESRAVGHPGSGVIGVERSGVLRAWTDPEAMKIIERRGIELLTPDSTVAALKPSTP